MNEAIPLAKSAVPHKRIRRENESEANFRTFFDAISDLVFVADHQGQIFFFNKSVPVQLGYSPAELRKMHILDVHPREYHDEAVTIFDDMFKGKRNFCPLPLAKKDGTFLPVETRVWFGKWDGKECIFGLSKNLTAEQEAHQRFERLFRHNPVSMALSELPDRQFMDVNDTFLKTFGYSTSEVIGKTVGDLKLFTDPVKHDAVANKLTAEGSVSGEELSLRCKDGAIIHGIFSGDVIRSHGKTYFLTVMVDITGRKRAESLLAKQSEELKTLNATKDKFFSIMTHDLRNPFNSILGFSELLLTQTAQKDYVRIEQYAVHIRNSSKRAMSLLKNIFDWSRSQTGRMEYAPCSLLLEGQVQEAIGLIKDSAIQKSLRLSSTIDPDLAVFADPAMIGTILRNLISNAVKFTLPGGTVIVEAVRNGDRVEVKVSDTGVGIDEESLANLFRIGENRSTMGTFKEPGTGLGLILCKEFVDKHGESIWVDSLPGKGSTFHFTLKTTASQ
jgi:PAS domain S-box-containing protein